jgi:hypothetical protein
MFVRPRPCADSRHVAAVRPTLSPCRTHGLRQPAARESVMSLRLALPLAVLACLSGCRGAETDSPVNAPGQDKSMRSRVLDAGADMIQAKAPLRSLDAYLDGFHFYNGRMREQMEAHHYCATLNEDVRQCVIYDGNTSDAKIMGVEYIISEPLFRMLPDDEKKLWHSHRYEVKSGELIAPGLPDTAEHALMEKLAQTYGKTFHTWHTDRDKTLPLGLPQLMMGFTHDGQIDPAMIETRDRRMGVRTADKRKQREDIQAPEVLPSANAWEHGDVVQIADPTGGHAMPGGQRDPAPASTVNARSQAR